MIKFDDDIKENKVVEKISKFNINQSNINEKVDNSSSKININFGQNVRSTEPVRNTSNKTQSFISAKFSTSNKELVEIQKLDVVKILDEKIRLTIENSKINPICDTIINDENSLFSILKTLPPFTWCCYKDDNINLKIVKNDYIKSISIEKMIEIQRKLDLIEHMSCFGNDEIIKIFKQQVN